jgi:hypothetical protein
MSFNGSSQRIFIPDYNALKLTHSMTIEAWIKSGPSALERGDILFRGDDHGGFDPYHLDVRNNGTLGAFMITSAADQSAMVTAPIVQHHWTHLAGTLDDATGAMRLYVNGVLAASTTTSIRPFADLDPTGSPGLGIGGLQSDNPFLNKTYFNGLIDEVRISDVALPPSSLLVPEPSLGLIGLVLVCMAGGHPTRRPRAG